MQAINILNRFNRSNFTVFLLVSIVLLQNPPWFLWGVNYTLLPIFILALIFLVKRKANKKEFLLIAILSFFVILHFAIYQILISKLQLSAIGVVLTFVALFYVDDKENIQVLSILTKLMALIVAISLPLWLLSLNFNFLPYGYIDYGTWKGTDEVLNIRNYYFFLMIDNLDIFRFYSIFDEPGVLGTLSAFLLLGNRYDFSKRENVLILLGGFFTFSLAFYILTMIGFAYVRSRGFFNFFLQILIGSSAAAILFFLLSSNEAFEASIVGKITGISENSNLNRNSIEVDRYFDEFLTSFNIFLGNGGNYIQEYFNDNAGQSYKLFVIQFGVYGFFLVFLMYFFIAKKYQNFKFACLALFLISFIQRPFLFTPWQLVVFAAVISSLNASVHTMSKK